jgi:hypothetical protein
MPNLAVQICLIKVNLLSLGPKMHKTSNLHYKVKDQKIAR